MRAVAKLLGELKKKDVNLWIDEDRIRYDAPQGALTPQDLEALRTHKATIIELLAQARGPADAPPVLPLDRAKPLPLSFGQQRLWFLDQLDASASAAYHMPLGLRLTGSLDVAALRAALERIVSRHEALRTRFAKIDGEAVQIVDAGVELGLAEHDLSDLAKGERDAAVERLVAAEAHEPFDLLRGPLLRARLLRLRADEHILLITLHHIASDGWSIGVLTREFGALYAAFTAGEPDPLPPLTIQYPDYAVWQRQWLRGETLASQLDFWREQLAGAPPLMTLPLDRPRPATQSYRGATLSFALDAEVTARLKALAKSHDTTLPMMLCATFAMLLSRLSDQSDMVIGMPIANRRYPEFEGLIGFFVNVLPLRLRVDGRSTIDELLYRAKYDMLKAYAHQDMPVDKLVMELHPERNLSHNPIGQVGFSFQNLRDEKLELARLTIEPVRQQWVTAKTDLTLIAGEHGNALECAFEYAVDLFDRSTIQAFADRFARLIGQVLARPEACLDDLDLTLPTGLFDIHAPHVLSTAQRTMWLDVAVHPENALNYVGAEWQELSGPIDPALFSAACSHVVATTTSLRAKFTVSAGEVRQRIRPKVEIDVPLLDFSSHGDPRAAAEQWMEKDVRTLQDPTGDARVHFALLKLAQGRFWWYAGYQHLTIDAFGSALIGVKLAQAYRALLAGEPLPDYDDRAAYVEYMRADAEYRYSRRFKGDQRFWSRFPRDAAPVTLSSRSNPLQTVNSLLCEGREMPRDLVRRMQARASDSSVSFPQFLIDAVTLYLRRVSGSETLSIGIPTHGRVNDAMRHLVASCANILPVALHLDGRMPVEQMVQYIAGEASQALRHHRHRNDEIRRSLQVKPTDGPIFNVIVNAIERSPALDFGVAESRALRGSLAGIDDLMIMILFTRDEPAFRVELHGSSRLYQSWELEQHVKLMEHFFEALMAAPGEAMIDSLPLLPDAERRRILDEFNATVTAIRRADFVHQLFEAHVAAQPTAIAVAHEGGELTYVELNRRANQLAHFLREQGVGPDARVAVLLERGVEIAVALLGILKAGCAYVPLDPAYPGERLGHMLGDSEPCVVLTQRALVSRLPETSATIIALDERAADLAQRSTSNLDIAAAGHGAANLAYVIYTSGSTGRPKGVMVEHRQLVNLVSALERSYELRPGDRVLLFAPISFDMSVEEFFGALCCGCTLVVRTDAWINDEVTFWRSCERFGVTVLNLPTAYWHQLAVGRRARIPECVRQIMVGGERVRPEVMAHWLRREGHRPRLLNAYGPTEATVNAAIGQIAGIDDAFSIGRPIANTRVHVLDSAGRVVPVGVTGEIFIAGRGVARGYLKRPELDAERFVPDPFGDDPAARMYRTGDLGRYLPDGRLECLGRNDHQVKIRGFRIELGEIEAQLSRIEAVREAVVLAREDTPGEMRLVAYVVAVENRELQIAELRGALSGVLPEYMVPAAFVVLPALPLTTSGKLDRRALPAPDASSVHMRAYEPPLGEVEMVLADAWRELLQVQTVGRNDHFFELGGHSLLAVALVERLRQRGLTADVRAIFTAPVLSDLAAAVAALTLAGQGVAEVSVPPNLIPSDCDAITPQMLPLVSLTQDEIERIVAATAGAANNVQDIYPLAPLQEGILFLHLLQPQGDIYLLPALLDFPTRAQLDAFLAALQRVIDRHDILRTAFAWEGLSEPVQVVWREARLEIEEVSFAEGDVAAQLDARFDPAHYRVDVRRAPLTRVCVAHDPQRARWLLKIVQHHLISDHTTLEIIVNEIHALIENDPSRLPAPVPFREFVAQARLGATREEHESFFRNMLGETREPTAPYGVIDLRGSDGPISSASHAVDPALVARLRRQVSRLHVSTASLMHLAWAQVLSRLTGRDEVVFGTVLFGRMGGGVRVDRVPGVFVNTLPIRLCVDETGVADSLIDAHQRLAQLMHHEHASLALAQRCSAVDPAVPLFTTLLNYRRHVQQGRATMHWNGVEVLHAEARTNYPITLSVNDTGDELLVTAQVAAKISPDAICAYLLTALRGLVESLEQSPEAALTSIEVLPATEHDRLLREWNLTAQPIPGELCIHRLFEEQAARTPDHVALMFEGDALTYRQLDDRASELARQLRARGVTSDRTVAVCLERGFDMVAGLLAVLKAGGAYVPLDPAYPRERLERMLEDSQPLLLLTQESLAGAFGNGVPVVCVDRGFDADIVDETSPAASNADSLAYVIYTSGSTGRPKGVAVSHRNVVSFLHAMRIEPGIESRDVLLAITPVSFDIAGLEIFLPLVNGATCVIASRAAAMDPARLDDDLARYQVTMMQATPSTWRTLVDHGWRPARQPFKLLCGGEALPRALAARLLERVPVVWNMYGPTETTIWSAVHAVRDLDRGVLIGRPIANTRIYLLDSRGRPAPVGVPGEVHIAGAGVARGYVGQPQLTAERFCADLHGDIDSRCYRTGDVARFTDDGCIEYLGRVDAQVKIRGHRIEPGEVESHLAQHAAVAAAVVVARTQEEGDSFMVAYVVPREEWPRDDLQTALRAHLLATLPEFMVPTQFVILDELPLTPNGKVDRKALPLPAASAIRTQYVAPGDGFEAQVAAIWAQVLKIEKIGIFDNFFELGGHSLRVIQAVSRMREAFGVDVPLNAMFTYPTVKTFVANARGMLPTPAAGDVGGDGYESGVF